MVSTPTLQDGKLEVLLDGQAVGEVQVPVLLDAVTCYTASQSPTSDMRLMLGPPWSRMLSPAHILETTRTGDDIHNVDRLTVYGSWDGKTSVWILRGGDEVSEEALLANVT